MHIIFLRSFFNKIEEKTGLSIIVSLHPRLLITDDLVYQYGNRRLILGKTAELVRDAELVLAHDTTAINFVALWSIPLVIITTNQIERAIYASMEATTQILKTTRININDSYDDIDFLEIAQRPIPQYDNFVENFIKVSGSSIQNSALILIKGLKKYKQ